ncbi:Hypothetical protein NocV09_02500050 [Nannochloropsis oceanica]
MTAPPLASSFESHKDKGGFMRRAMVEVGFLALCLAAELGWWHFRSRYSLAPEGSEKEDGLLLVSLVSKVYVGARLVLWVTGKGFQTVQRQHAVTRALSYLLLFLAGGFAFHALEGGKLLLGLIKQNHMLFILYNHLISAPQQAYFKGEAFFFLRILAALLSWQILLTVSFWLLTTLLLIPVALLSLLPSSSTASSSASSMSSPPSSSSSSSSPEGTPVKGRGARLPESRR